MKIRAFWLVFEADGAEVCSFRGFNGLCCVRQVQQKGDLVAVEKRGEAYSQTPEAR